MSREGKPLRIDIHTHILPKSYPNLRERYGYGGFISLVPQEDGNVAMWQGDKFFRLVEPNCFDIEARIQDMDKTGVDVQVISTIPVMFSYWAKPEDTEDLCHILNNDIAETVKAYPKRFIGLGTLPMQDPARAIVELRRCINELGLVGVQISSHVNEWNLNAPELFPIFEEAEKLGAVIFVHPWDMMGEQDMKEFWLPWLVGMPAETTRAVCSLIFGGVFERLPNLKVCFAHGAGAFCFTLGRIEHGFNCRPDLVAIKNNVPPSNYLGKFWVDSLTHDSDMLYHLVKKCGKDKIILGSDYPFPLGEQEPGKLIDEMTEIDDQTKALLLGKNCLEFMGLSEEKFL